MARVGVGVEVERSTSPRVRRRLAPGDRLEVVARGAGEEGAQLREGRGAPEVEFRDHASMMAKLPPPSPSPVGIRAFVQARFSLDKTAAPKSERDVL